MSKPKKPRRPATITITKRRDGVTTIKASSGRSGIDLRTVLPSLFKEPK